MAVKSRLQDGRLLLAGEVNERLPVVQDGLVAHFPFDNSVKGIGFNNILDYSTWVIGTNGTQTGFFRNGLDSENTIIEMEDPWGKKTAVWKAFNSDLGSDSDGGWNGSNFSIDNTYKYRFSVWINVFDPATDGTVYLGTHGYGSTNGVYNRSNGELNTNPYFKATPVESLSLNHGTWLLWVGHVWEAGSGTGSSDEDSGVYDLRGNKVYGCNDFVWHEASTTSNHRAYLYYTIDPDTDVRFCYPRVDKCDGTEPTIEDLLTNELAINIATIQGDFLSPKGMYLDGNVTNLYGDMSTSSQLRTPREEFFTYGIWDGRTPMPPENIGRVYKHTSGSLSATWSGNSYGYTYKDITTTNTETYTLSVWTFVSEDCDIDVMKCSIEQATSLSNATGYSDYYDMTKKGTWQKLVRRCVADDSVRFLSIYPSKNGVIDGSFNGYYMWGGVQVELGAYPSRFGDESGASRGGMDLPGELINLTEGSYIFSYTVTSDETDGNYPHLIGYGWWSNPISRDWVGFYRGNGWNSANTITGGFHDNSAQVSMGYWVVSDANSRVGHELILGVGWSVIEGKARWWCYDKTDETILCNVDVNNGSFDGLDIGEEIMIGDNTLITHGEACTGIYKDLSIYNRMLSVSEFELLSRNKHALSDDLYVNEIIEEIPENIIQEENPYNWYFSGLTREYVDSFVRIISGTYVLCRIYIPLELLEDGQYYCITMTVRNPGVSTVNLNIDFCDAGSTNFSIEAGKTTRITTNPVIRGGGYTSTYRFFDFNLPSGETLDVCNPHVYKYEQNPKSVSVISKDSTKIKREFIEGVEL